MIATFIRSAGRPGRAACASLLVIAAALLAHCGSENSVTGPSRNTILRVFVRNDTGAAFTVSGSSIAPGATAIESSHTPLAANSDAPFVRAFEIRRDNLPVARVTYRVLRYDEGTTRDVSIAVSERSPSGFEATTPDGSWITIVATQQL